MIATAANHLDTIIHLLQLNFGHLKIRACARWSNHGWSTPDPIFADDLEISCVESGSRHFRYADATDTHHPGDIVFMDCSGPAVCLPGKFTYTSVILVMEQSTPAAQSAYRRLRQHFAALRHLPAPSNRSEWPLLQLKEMYQEFLMDSAHHHLRIKLLLLQFLIELQRCLTPAPSGTVLPHKRYRTLTAQVIAHLSDRLDENISLAELGAQFNHNPKHLNRIFKQVTGSPIKRYQQELKIEKAKKLLRASSMNLLEIALELGFQSSQYLNYYFKKAVGLTPNIYRKRYGEPRDFGP